MIPVAKRLQYRLIGGRNLLTEVFIGSHPAALLGLGEKLVDSVLGRLRGPTHTHNHVRRKWHMEPYPFKRDVTDHNVRFSHALARQNVLATQLNESVVCRSSFASQKNRHTFDRLDLEIIITQCAVASDALHVEVEQVAIDTLQHAFAGARNKAQVDDLIAVPKENIPNDTHNQCSQFGLLLAHLQHRIEAFKDARAAQFSANDVAQIGILQESLQRDLAETRTSVEQDSCARCGKQTKNRWLVACTRTSQFEGNARTHKNLSV